MGATIWKTERLTPQGELHHQDAPGLVPQEAFPLVASLRTQEKQREKEEGGMKSEQRRVKGERQEI